ncbi:MAG TPA: hypothetical protein VJ826_12230 [Candidatus Polarisedimenticolaceae bacterium]|nr:hypothetical protein [Candidatus Polarisedimenticolaceae bacterium]
MRAAIALTVAILAGGTALAADPPKAETKDIGFAIGPSLPAAGISDGYDYGVFATLRGYYFPAASRHGVRAALWGAWATGSSEIDDGFGGGVEMNYAAHFGAGEAPFSFFIGAGLAGSDYIAVSGSLPGATQIHISGSAFTGNIGIGYMWKRMFVEASYVEVFDDQKNFGFVPVVLGIRF